MQKTFFSRRIYINELETSILTDLSGLNAAFNRAVRFAFHTQVREKRWNKILHKESLHLVVKHKFGFNDYIANSAVRKAKAIFNSQTELNKLYVKQTNEKITKLKKKLKKERTSLTSLIKIKESCIKGNLRFPRNRKYTIHPSGIISLERKNETLIWMNTYLFEHRYLDVRLKRIKSRIGRLEHRLHRLQLKLEKLKTKVPSCVFGSKKLFKSQFTIEEYRNDHSKWRTLFLKKRNKEVLISGRKDAKSGNFVFSYKVDTKELFMTSIGGRVITFPNVYFPYGQENVESTIRTQQECKDKKKYGKPISWSVEVHGEYFIVKCLIDVEREVHINFSTSDGVIGIDCNVDHFAWSNVTKDGNYLESGVIPFSVLNKKTGQVTKIIEKAVIELVDIAVKNNKIIVMEDIDTTLSKTGDAYGNKKANHLKSIFAYRKMAQAIESRSEKMGVAISKVNPAYTSISGKYKYMRKFGISVHQAASFTIGRRGLGYKEKAPKVLHKYIVRNQTYWKQWSDFNKKVEKAKLDTNAIYQLYNVNHPDNELAISL